MNHFASGSFHQGVPGMKETVPLQSMRAGNPDVYIYLGITFSS